MDELIVQGEINSRILTLRGKQVMLDRDLAELYQVETKVLNQAVKRNIKRFPSDFMFQMSQNEFENWRSQFVTSNSDRMGLRRAPYAFGKLLKVTTSGRSKGCNLGFPSFPSSSLQLGDAYIILSS